MSRSKRKKKHSAEDGLVCCSILLLSCFTYFSILKMEAIFSFETPAYSEIHGTASLKAILFTISTILIVTTFVII
jgi:hypothetical protein